MAKTRKTTSIEQNSMEYLNDLRDSGDTNMFGARPYLMREFPELSKKEAGDIMSLWMKNFNEEGEYETIKE